MNNNTNNTPTTKTNTTTTTTPHPAHQSVLAGDASRGMPRLKCIVLGSASAGKTSILRRYFHRTFEHGRSSTMGGDFYSRKIPNPLAASASTSSLSMTSERKKKKTKKKRTKTKKSSRDKKKTRTKETEGMLLPLSLSILEQQSSTIRQQQQTNNDTTNNTNTNIPIPRIRQQSNPQIALQIWDTAGRERLADTTTPSNNVLLTSALGDRFFEGVDAAILVYDATSTPSFLQLIRWHSELLERISYSAGDGENGSGRRRRGRCASVGITVVANKLDRVEAVERSRRLRHTQQQQSFQSIRRDIMRLRGINYNGKDSHYEYSVASHTRTGSNTTISNTTTSTTNTTTRMTPTRSSREKYNDSGNRKSTLSYGPGGGQLSSAAAAYHWSTDRSYLDYIKQAEDCCIPDRNMVQLWCRRNGLQFVEVSALDGTGVDHAVESTVRGVLDMRQQYQQQQRQCVGEDGRMLSVDDEEEGVGSAHMVNTDCYVWKEQGVDFYERYGTQESCFRLLSCFSRLRQWRHKT